MNITSGFGTSRGGGSRSHRGIDIAPVQRNVDGDSIYSVNAGIVKYSAYRSSYGNFIVIEHTATGFCSAYAHLSQRYVSVGAIVSAGTIIGAMGNTGDSTGTHLHFEVHDTLYGSGTSKDGFWSYQYFENPALYLGNASSATTTQLGSTSYIEPNQEIEYNRYTPDLTTVTGGDLYYGRRYRLIISDKNKDGFDLSNMRIVFSVRKTILLETVYSVIRVYNLNSTTENAIIQAGIRVTLEAGYEGENFGVIFDGDVVQVVRGKENATDYYIDIVSVDSERFLNDGFVEFSMLRGQTQRTVIDHIAQSATNPASLGNISSTYNNQELIRGKVVFGKAKDYLHQIAKSGSAQFYMEDGRVNLIRAEDLPNDEIFRLTYESGLIGIPEQTEQGVNIQCLLNPRIKCNSRVSIDNESIVERQIEVGTLQRLLDRDGVYRVIAITYVGDTRGDEWYANLQTVSQPGYLPAILADSSANPYY